MGSRVRSLKSRVGSFPVLPWSMRCPSCGSASARGVSNDTSSKSFDVGGGLVDSLYVQLVPEACVAMPSPVDLGERASPVRVLDRRSYIIIENGPPHDLRDRGDDWPLLPVVSGLSRARCCYRGRRGVHGFWQRCGWLLCAHSSSAAAMAWPRLTLSLCRCAALRTSPTRCAVQSLDCAALRPSSLFGQIMLLK